MNIPITTEQFLSVFRAYNLAVWPLQIVLILVAAAIVLAALRGVGSRAASAALGVLWLWTGIVYHAIHFAPVNPAAVGFAAMFVVEGALIIALGAWRDRLRLHATFDARGLVGGAMIVYALLVYPMLAMGTAHAYPQSPTFGLPCPTTIFTFGLLLWAEDPAPRSLVVIPALWSVIALGAFVQFGIAEDVGLIASAVVATLLLLKRRGSGRAVLPEPLAH